MKLYINTAEREKITVGVDSEMFEAETKDGSSQRLLSFIYEILERKNITLSDIKEIEVNIGPGSFTGLKVGVAIANTLAWVLNIKVNGKEIEDNISYS